MIKILNKKIGNSNFYWKEFTYSALANHNVDLNSYNMWLVRHIVQYILQPIRDEFGPVFILSGIRDKITWNALNKHGLSPSKTTDHAYLDPNVYQFGVGAADFTIGQKDINLTDVYDWVYKQVINHEMYIGQLIIYPDHNFIHISNPKSLVFSSNFSEENGISILDLNKFLKKTSNGFESFLP